MSIFTDYLDLKTTRAELVKAIDECEKRHQTKIDEYKAGDGTTNEEKRINLTYLFKEYLKIKKQLDSVDTMLEAAKKIIIKELEGNGGLPHIVEYQGKKRSIRLRKNLFNKTVKTPFVIKSYGALFAQ